jgi:hypothetical protein
MKPNARLHLLPEAGARDERRLETVRCKPWLGCVSHILSLVWNTLSLIGELFS